MPARVPANKGSISTRVRDARCVELRAMGLSWQEVADQVELATATSARRAALRCLDRVEHESAEQMRRFEDRHLLAARKKLMATLARADDREVPKIVNSLVNLSARRSAMLGLNQPTQIEVSPGASNDEFAVVAEALLQQAGRPVPHHIALDARAARQRGVLPPAPLLAMPTEPEPVVVDAEIVTDPEVDPLPEGTPVASNAARRKAELAPEPAPVTVGGPSWTDDGEIVAPFAVVERAHEMPEKTAETGASEPLWPPQKHHAEPVVDIEGWKLGPDHPLVERPSFGSALDRRQLA